LGPWLRLHRLLILPFPFLLFDITHYHHLSRSFKFDLHAHRRWHMHVYSTVCFSVMCIILGPCVAQLSPLLFSNLAFKFFYISCSYSNSMVTARHLRCPLFKFMVTRHRPLCLGGQLLNKICMSHSLCPTALSESAHAPSCTPPPTS
jgi:hypothetical protein